LFRIAKDTELTLELLQEFLTEHQQQADERYKKLKRAYESDHDILYDDKKPNGKPDNRIVINFPKYIVDTMNGFFIGNPIKVTAEDKAVSDFVEYLDQYNDQDDNNSELAKICSIYGKGFEMYYTDEDSELCITYLDPIEAFMIYDDSIVERPLYFVRRYTDRDGNEWGSISNSFGVRYFKVTGGLQWLGIDEEEIKKNIDKYNDGWEAHYFPGVPATEYVENRERQGIFEPVLTPINAYNKIISEKANDVDYFADAYLKVLGADLDEAALKHIRDNRIINFPGDDASKIVVEFVGKPESDTTQENALNRMERLIFQISMVANISDENFGAATGIALKYKLQAMNNLFKTKERKFSSGMNRRYKLLFGHPASKVPADAWLQLHYQFTPNIPANLLEEAQIAAQLEGITSHETQLKVVSIVDNVENELEKIEEENKPDETSIVERLTFGNAAHTHTEETPAEEEGLNNGTD
jgi:SPP1 family phage portal protein